MAGERILVVDDEPGVRSALEGILRDERFRVVAVGSGEEGIEELGKSSYDAVLLDVWLPGMDGLETLDRIRERGYDSSVVMISGHGTIETAVKATKLGAFDFIEKPLSLEKTLLVLRNAIRQRRLERINRRLVEQLDRDTEIVGGSPAAERLRSVVAAAAAGEAPVLICGDVGSGRQLVARRIHAAGSRSGEAFVEMPCGALDEEAAAAALFAREGGRLRLAERGTLFLEDVDRLPPALQERLAARLDAAPPDEPGVRLIGSTERGADALRPALRHYMDVLRIDVPPLRERREDIPALAERFLRDLAREYGREGKRLSPDCIAALTAHDWPGNVRELRNLMERLLLLSERDGIGLEDLPPDLGGVRGPAEDLYREFGSLREGLETFERYYIRRVLREQRGSMEDAARRLGVAPGRLEARMKRLGLAGEANQPRESET